MDANLDDSAALERASEEIDRFVERRAGQRLKAQAAEEGWKKTTREFHDRRQEELRLQWHEWHLDQAERLRRTLQGLVEYHEARVSQLEEGVQ